MLGVDTRAMIKAKMDEAVKTPGSHQKHAAQTFLKKTFDYLEEHYVHTGKEKFIAWHIHSDNAPSHSKSSKTMYYLTSLPSRLASWAASLPISFRVFWEFGAPGHGKGVWDGIGAWIKRTVRQDIVDHRSERPTVKTKSGYIRWPSEVAEHVTERLNTDAYVQSHLNATINEVVVAYTSTSEIKRPPVEHEYDSIPGIKKTFLFMPVRQGVVLERKFACWCAPCMQASAPGEGSMDSNCRCVECKSNLPWKETGVDRSDATGIANGRKDALALAHSLAEQLEGKFKQSTNSVWVAVQNRGEEESDQYFIGKAVRIVKTFQEAGSVGRTRYDKGDMEIEVEWYHRDISGGDERRIFKRWMRDEEAGDPGPDEKTTYTFNSTQLRSIGVKMQLVPPVGGVPLEVVREEARPVRLAAKAAGQNVRNILFTARKQRATPPEQLWEIPTGEESEILLRCSR